MFSNSLLVSFFNRAKLNFLICRTDGFLQQTLSKLKNLPGI